MPPTRFSTSPPGRAAGGCSRVRLSVPPPFFRLFFFLQYTKYLENHTVTGARSVFQRACGYHLPRKPNIHLLWAAFEEKQGEVAPKRTIFRVRGGAAGSETGLFGAQGHGWPQNCPIFELRCHISLLNVPVLGGEAAFCPQALCFWAEALYFSPISFFLGG